MYDDESIQIVSAESKHLPEILRLLKESFHAREPLACTLGLTWQDEGPIFEQKLGGMIDQGFSFVALDTLAQNRLIACRISLIVDLNTADHISGKKDDLDSEPDFVQLPGDDNPTILALASVFRQLTRGWTRKLADCQRIFDFVLVCVEETYSRRGIAKRMIERSLALAEREDLRIDYIYVLATNWRTQRMFENLNFFTIHTVEYEEFRDETTGQPLISKIHDGSTCAKWMAKNIRKD